MLSDSWGLCRQMLLLFINCSVKIKVLTESPSGKFWLFGERRHWGRDLAVLLEKPFWSPGVLIQDKLAWEINHGIWLLRPLALHVWVGDKTSTVLKRYMEKKHTFKWKLEVVAFDSFRKKLLFLQSYTRLGWGHIGFILMCILTVKTLLANYRVQIEYACVGNLLA